MTGKVNVVLVDDQPEKLLALVRKMREFERLNTETVRAARGGAYGGA